MVPVYFTFFLATLWLVVLRSIRADVIVISNINYTRDVFNDMPANFGGSLSSKGLMGLLIYSEPDDACGDVQPPPNGSTYFNPTGNWILLARRHDCNFSTKVRNAQKAGYNASIIHNVGSNSIEEMYCHGDCSDIHIPSVFIGQDDGFRLQIYFVYTKGYYVMLTDELPFSLNTYLLPFAIVIGVCFLVMLIFMIVKCIKDRRRARRHRMPSRSLKKIPTTKYKKGDPYDVCAVCLEEYNEGDKLRLLPCNHVYHTKCIDPWLTRNKRVCPCCKRKVFAHNERPPPPDSDSDSDDDGSTTQGESQPLLGSRRAPRGRNTQGGTFQPPSSLPRNVLARPRQQSTSSSDSERGGAVGYSASEPDTAYHSGDLSEVEQHRTPKSSNVMYQFPPSSSVENSINADVHESEEGATGEITVRGNGSRKDDESERIV